MLGRPPARLLSHRAGVAAGRESLRRHPPELTALTVAQRSDTTSCRSESCADTYGGECSGEDVGQRGKERPRTFGWRQATTSSAVHDEITYTKCMKDQEPVGYEVAGRLMTSVAARVISSLPPGRRPWASSASSRTTITADFPAAGLIALIDLGTYRLLALPSVNGFSPDNRRAYLLAVHIESAAGGSAV